MEEGISFKDFQKLDLRVGTVVEAVVPEWSHWVIKLTVDFGEEIGKKTVFSGMMGHYKAEDFVGNQYPFLINITPKKIGPENEKGERAISEAMMLAASVEAETGKEEDEVPVLLCVSKKVPDGTKIR